MTTKVHAASSLIRLVDIAEKTGKKPGTIRQWSFRGYLPEPDFMVWDIPAWKPETIQPFIERVTKTGSGVNASAHE